MMQPLQPDVGLLSGHLLSRTKALGNWAAVQDLHNPACLPPALPGQVPNLQQGLEAPPAPCVPVPPPGPPCRSHWAWHLLHSGASPRPGAAAAAGLGLSQRLPTAPWMGAPHQPREHHFRRFLLHFHGRQLLGACQVTAKLGRQLPGTLQSPP